MKETIGKLGLGVAVVCAMLVALGTVALMDKSYMTLLLPFSYIGLSAWAVAAGGFWRRWSLLFVPIYFLPFIPVSWWY